MVWYDEAKELRNESWELVAGFKQVSIVYILTYLCETDGMELLIILPSITFVLHHVISHVNFAPPRGTKFWGAA